MNLSVLRCYLLIRHYCAAIMWSAGIKPAEPHCTLKTIQIMREIIESPVHNADGSGAMLVIRIPSVELANLAFESLKNTRDRLVVFKTSLSSRGLISCHWISGFKLFTSLREITLLPQSYENCRNFKLLMKRTFPQTENQRWVTKITKLILVKSPKL